MLRRAAVFHAVGLAGGITAAGTLLGKSPPAVHADLRQFERDVGVALTERAGRSLKLTTQGRAIFKSVGKALAEIERACASAHDETPTAPFRVGSVSGFGRYRLLPRLLPMIDAARRLLLTTDTLDALVAGLVAGQIDLAVTYRSVVAAPLTTVPLAVEELGLVGAKGFREADEAARGRLPFVTYDEYEYVFARWFDEAAGGQPAVLRRHDHFTELEEALASVAAGRGVTVAPLDASKAFGLECVGPPCSNIVYLCGTRSALASADAVAIRELFPEILPV